MRGPEDAALAMFDDMPFGDVIQPRLAAVAQPEYDIGHQGVELLIGRITDKDPVHLQLDASSAAFRRC
ncbi:MAG: hypothetical protein NTW28_27680 [Candidatus Solibacter sp.]|nr:hypothetical protein [Candidatus Solibacter sp.]